MNVRKWIPYAPIAAATFFLFWITTRAVTARLGHAGAALDDAYIHFQYARAIAEGHPFRYQAGEPISTGATSALWPILLAPFYLLGFRDELIMWPAWILSFAALGLLAHEAAEMTRPLAGKAAAACAAAMVLLFGGHLWCAASGMEVVPFAWVLVRAFRKAAEWCESDASEKTKRVFWELAALGWAAFLFRPEGAVATLAIVLVFVLFPRDRAPLFRARDAAIAVALPALFLIFLRLATGSASTSTASVKLLWGNPYYRGDAFVTAVSANVRVFFETLMQGQIWSAEFLPSGALPFAAAGLAATALCGWQTKKTWRAAFVIVLALEMLAPTTYVTFLWNRLRYLWPFTTGWLIGLACLARVTGDALGSVRPSWRVATPLMGGVFAGMLGSRISGVVDDVANSASGIDRQHVVLGRWAKDNVPAGARIGVNDTGAIAYFGDHPTFDVVGLTTPGEGRYWVAGAGSRFEHYERMHATTPDRLPAYFIVYPEWMGCDPVLGDELYSATVTDSTILGGQTMNVYRATYVLMGSASAPWTEDVPPGAKYDELDVADLESETAHRYELLGARDGEEIVTTSLTPDGRTVADGGRTNRTNERFVVTLAPGVPWKVIVRLASQMRGTLQMLANGREIGSISLEGGGEWEEIAFEIPADAATERTTIELHTTTPATTYHYYFWSR